MLPGIIIFSQSNTTAQSFTTCMIIQDIRYSTQTITKINPNLTLQMLNRNVNDFQFIHTIDTSHYQINNSNCV